MKNTCSSCPLNGAIQVPPEGNLETANVVFVGEAPGLNEEKQGRPFVGRAGQYLRSALESIEINEEDCYFTNVCKCRPEGNRTPLGKEISSCKRKLMVELENYKGLIVLLGAVPLKAVLGKHGINNYQGYGFTQENNEVFVMNHPAYILRNKGTSIEDNFLTDLIKVSTYLNKTDTFVYKKVVSQEDVKEMLDYFLKKETVVAFDIETTGLSWKQDDIICLSFSDGQTHFVIPVQTHGYLIDQAKEIFYNKKIKTIAQGGKFDIKFLKEKYGIEVRNFYFDTQIAHYLLYGKYAIHALKACAWKYTFEGGYGLDRVDLSQYPLDRVLKYCAQDSYITHKLMDIYKKDMSALQMDLMEHVLAPGVCCISEMEYTGVSLDIDELTRVVDIYVEKTENLRKKMFDYKDIQAFQEKEGELNLRSPKQLRKLLVFMGIDPGVRTKTTGVLSTNEEALHKVKDRHSFISDLLQYRADEKVLGTYLKPYVERNVQGKINASYSFIGTATGRLASSKPNFQNIPYDTRPVFKSKNGYFLEVDYSQLELRVLAMLSKDEGLMDDFAEGRDVHESTRFTMYGDNSQEDNSTKKRQRVNAKSVNFGLVYGISCFGLSKSLEVSEKEAQAFIDKFYREHPAIREYQRLVQEHVRKYGYIDTPFGRKREFLWNSNLPEGRRNAMMREAINTPIQSTASDIVICGIGKVWNKMRDKDMKSRMVAEVHDSCLFDCFENELEMLTEMCKEEMEYFKYHWMLDVPLKIDLALGTHWGKLEDF